MLHRLTLSLLIGLAPLLAGCALPDLVAHAVKEVERSQRESTSRSSPPDAQPEAPRDRAEDEAPPPVAAPQPRRSSVTVEELPAR